MRYGKVLNKRRGLGTSVCCCALDKGVDVDKGKTDTNIDIDTEITYKPKGRILAIISDVAFCLVDEKADYEDELRGYWRFNRTRDHSDVYETEYMTHGVNCSCKCTPIESAGDHCR